MKSGLTTMAEFETFVRGIEDAGNSNFLSAPHGDEGAVICADRIRAISMWAKECISQLEKKWCTHVQSATRSMHEVLPPKVLVINPQILSNKSMQATLFDNPGRKHIASRLASLVEVLQVLQTASESGLNIGKDFKTIYNHKRRALFIRRASFTRRVFYDT